MISAKAAALDTVASIRFAGEKLIHSAPELAVMAKVRALPETALFHSALLEKALPGVMRRAFGANAPQARPLARELADDVGRAASGFELYRMESGKALWTMTFEVSAEKAAIWSTNLWRLVSLTTLGQPKAAEGGGDWSWTASNSDKGYHLAFGVKEGWVVVSGGESGVPTATPLAAKPSSALPADGRLAQFSANLPAIGGMADIAILLGAPKISGEAIPQGDGVKGEFVFDFQFDLPVQVKPWLIPADTIRDPLVSFSAIQGIGPLLALLPQFQGLGPAKTPDQLFAWSQETSAFSVSAAADVGNPVEMIGRFINDHLAGANQKLQSKAMGRLAPSEDKRSISWRDLPMIVPTFGEGVGADAGFLHLRLFPTTNPGNDPAPAGLFDQLRQSSNILGYDWEITEMKIAQMRPLLQIAQIMKGDEFSPPDGVGQKWLAAVAPLLGNTITEMTLAGPRQIKITRRSHVGHNALELALAASWVDAKPTSRRAKPSANP